MLQTLYVDNYKCLANFRTHFGNMQLLIGPNGVGKSALFDVLFAIRRLLAEKVPISDADVFPTSTLTRWDTRPRQRIELTVALSNDIFKYELEVEHELETKRSTIALERLSATDVILFQSVDGEVELHNDYGRLGVQFHADASESFLARIVPRKENKRLTRFLGFIRNIIVCGIYPRSLAPESSTEDTTLVRDGRNFASWYRHVMQQRSDLLPMYSSALAEVLDGLRGIALEQVSAETRMVKVRFGAGEGFWFRLDELSDGQRALMVLYALLHFTTDQRCTLVLDEPDNYVAMAEIQPWLMGLSDACAGGSLQAILSSHHPELIDYLGPERTLLLQREAIGPTTIRSVAEAFGTQSGLRLSELIARGWTQ